MNPERSKKVGKHTIEEFYWAGEWVVYVDNRSSDLSYEDACKKYEVEEGESA